MENKVKKKFKKRSSTLKWLKTNGQTQNSFAESLGVGLMTVYFWLHRSTTPHDIYVVRLIERAPECPMLGDTDVLGVVKKAKQLA